MNVNLHIQRDINTPSKHRGPILLQITWVQYSFKTQGSNTPSNHMGPILIQITGVQYSFKSQGSNTPSKHRGPILLQNTGVQYSFKTQGSNTPSKHRGPKDSLLNVCSKYTVVFASTSVSRTLQAYRMTFCPRRIHEELPPRRPRSRVTHSCTSDNDHY